MYSHNLTCRKTVQVIFLNCRLFTQHLHTFLCKCWLLVCIPYNTISFISAKFRCRKTLQVNFLKCRLFTHISLLLFSPRSADYNFSFVAVENSKLIADLPVQKHFGNRFPPRIFCYILQFDPFMLFIGFHVLFFLLRCHTVCRPSRAFSFEFQPGIEIVFKQADTSVLRGKMPHFMDVDDVTPCLYRLL